MTTEKTVSVQGNEIKYDRSGGQGHCWVPATEYDCPPSIQEEIAAEIIDGGNESCNDYTATNGCHYRW